MSKTLTKSPVFARQTITVVTEHGLPVRMEFGEAWDPSDQIVRDRPELFSSAPPMRTYAGVYTFVD